MNKCHVEYSTKIRGRRIDKPIDFSIRHPVIDKVIMEPGGTGNIILRFVVNTLSVDDAVIITRDLADKIVEKLSLFFIAYVETPHFLGAQLTTVTTSENGSTSFNIVSMLPALQLKAQADSEYIPSSTEIEDLIKELQDESPQGAQYSTAFWFAMINTDPITRYMWLYNILLQIHNDEQKLVDDFIRTIEPGVSESPRPDKPHIKETIYTRLRNEIGHRRIGANPGETRREIERRVNNFASLVKEAIRRSS